MKSTPSLAYFEESEEDGRASATKALVSKQEHLSPLLGWFLTSRARAAVEPILVHGPNKAPLSIAVGRQVGSDYECAWNITPPPSILLLPCDYRRRSQRATDADRRCGSPDCISCLNTMHEAYFIPIFLAIYLKHQVLL